MKELHRNCGSLVYDRRHSSASREMRTAARDRPTDATVAEIFGRGGFRNASHLW
jgi:hypothetical protein